MSNERIKKLCQEIDKFRISRHPIMNELLKKETDYIRDSYFKMLAVILLGCDNRTQEQDWLYHRLLAGLALDGEKQEYYRRAMDIEIGDYVEFTDQLSKMPLRFRFLIDAILLCKLGKEERDAWKLVANFAEFLNMNREEVEYMGHIATTVLTQNIETLSQWKKPTSIPEQVGIEYLREIQDNSVYRIDGKNITIHDLKSVEDHPADKILLSHLDIDISNYPLMFSNYKEVILEHCIFHGGQESIRFDRCDRAIIRSCYFKDFSCTTILQNSVGDMRIIDTRFENCVKKYTRGTEDWKQSGCVISGLNMGENRRNMLSGCTFKNCGGANASNYYTSAFISDIKSELENCQFENCWHYHSAGPSSRGSRDPEHNERRMFTKDTVALGCKIINSADLV